MNDQVTDNESHSADDSTDPADHVETFADGEVSARHGRVNRWLLVVYVVLFAWSLYYGITYWGGLGPGLDY